MIGGSDTYQVLFCSFKSDVETQPVHVLPPPPTSAFTSKTSGADSSDINKTVTTSGSPITAHANDVRVTQQPLTMPPAVTQV